MVISYSHRLDGEKNPILAAALELAEFGFYIYPSPKKNGAARVKWRLNSTRDSATITRWWTQWPRDLICLDCGKSKIAVIDADSIEDHGIDGLTNVLDLELQHGLLPETLKARTPSGGEHSFFRDPEGKMKSTAGVLAAGVDTRGVGGMIVLAPSLVKGKGAYSWTNDLPIAELPQWVIDKVGTPAEQGPVPDAEFEPAYNLEQFEERLKLIDVGAVGPKRGRRRNRQPENQKLPAEVAKAGRMLSPERMRIVLDSLREVPILHHAATKAGIHRKTLEYWLRRSAAGDAGYDIEWQGIEWRFHEHCTSAIDEAADSLRAVMWHAMGLAKTDENGNFIVEACGQLNSKMARHFLEWQRPEQWGRKRHVPHNGGVLVIGGDVTKKPEYDTTASVKAGKWKSFSRKFREAKT